MRWWYASISVVVAFGLWGCGVSVVPALLTPTPVPIAPQVDNLGAVQPLVPVTTTLTLPGIRDALLVQIKDASGTAVFTQTVTPQTDQTVLTVVPKGAIGVATLTVGQAGQTILTAPAYTLDPQSTLVTDDPVFTNVFTQTVGFLQKSVRSYDLNGHRVQGYRSPDNPLLWLRDHVYQGRGFRYIEPDVKSLLEAFRDAQRPDGSLPDWLDMPALGVAAGRKDVEADVEFLFAQGVYEAWQMTGDDAWMRQMLPAVQRALAYTMSDPVRWDAKRGLIRRPYTIDMWDFAYGPTTKNPATGVAAPRHWIDDQTIWGTFHGDNTGLIQALRMTATMENAVGDDGAAKAYRRQANDIQKRLMKLSWNGQFFQHFVPEDSTIQIPGVDISTQLSLSNAYALNREIVDGAAAQAILATYYQRGLANPAIILPWYSMDPPFPAAAYGMAGRKGEQPGEYVNGGIMPLVGGELARGAFTYGSESFGFDILRHYEVLINRFGGSYLWYYPNGQPGISGPDTLPTDGWGASAMLGALMEGAAGVLDAGTAYQSVKLTPRWQASGVHTAYVVARYPASQGYVAYDWQLHDQQITLTTTGSGKNLAMTIPLPETVTQATVLCDGQPVPKAFMWIKNRPYVFIKITGLTHTVQISW